MKQKNNCGFPKKPFSEPFVPSEESFNHLKNLLRNRKTPWMLKVLHGIIDANMVQNHQRYGLRAGPCPAIFLCMSDLSECQNIN